MAREEFTDNELIRALVDALEFQNDDDGFIRAEDIADALGWNIDRTRRHLRALLRDDMIEVGRVYRKDLSGRVQPVAAYRLKQGQE